MNVGLLDAFLLHRLGHLRPVIPHRGGDVDRRAELGEVIEARPHHAPRAAVSMADDAALLREELAPGLGIAGRVEVVQGEEESDQVRRLSGVQARAGDAQLLHPCRHPLQMVPQVGCEIVEGAGSRDAREVRSDLASDPVHRMTLRAPLGAEHPGAGHRVLTRSEEGLGPRRAHTQQDERDNDSGPSHGHAHWRPFLPVSRRPPEGAVPSDGRMLLASPAQDNDGHSRAAAAGS